MGIMINQHKNPYWRNQFFGTKRCQRKLHNFLLRHLRGSLTIQTTPGIQLKNRSSFISFCPEVPNSQVKNGTTPPHLMLKFSILPTRGYTMSKPIPPRWCRIFFSVPVCSLPSSWKSQVGSSSDGLKSIHKELGASDTRYTRWLERWCEKRCTTARMPKQLGLCINGRK